VIAEEPTLTPSPEVEAERRLALRALLRRPLLTASGETGDEFVLVRHHSVWLKQWFSKFPAWTLHIDRDVARLHKVPADLLDDTRTAADRGSGTPFSRRRYAVLCLVLAALERLDHQTTLGQIAHTVMQFISEDRILQAAGLTFDANNYDHRRDLVHAMRLLIDLGVLRRLDGNERHFLNRTDSSDVLCEIQRPALSAMLNVSRSASAVELEMNSTTGTGTSVRARATGLLEGDDPSVRPRLIRALLDDPVVYFRDLNDDERAHLESHRGYLLRQIHEVREEGIAMVDDAGDLTDLRLPDETPEGRLGLELVQWLAECSRARDGAAIPLSEIEAHVRQGRVTEVLERLRGLRLIQWTEEGIVPLAACGRYGTSEV
jgi:uncharacterized protein (TIGR02678 family)